MAENVSLETFVEDCRKISNLVSASGERDNLPYLCIKGLRNGEEIIRDVITYFSRDANQRHREEDASVLRTAEFGLQTLRDSCMIAEDEGRGGGMLTDLRAIINTIGKYSIKAGDLEYSFSRITVTPKDEALLEAVFPLQKISDQPN